SLAEAIRARPEHPWSVMTAVAAILLLLSGGYKRLETVTTILVAGVTLVTVGSVIMLSRTENYLRPENIQEGFSLAVLKLPPAAIAAAFAAFGITGVGASELYAYPYWCLEKGYARSTGRRSDNPAWAERARGWLRVMILDAWVSMVVFTVATVAFYFLGAAVLHRQIADGLMQTPKGPKMILTLSEMYVHIFGPWTKIVFMIGAWAVLFKTLYVASAGHARLSADFLSMLRLVDYRQPGLRHRWIQRFCVF